MKKIKSIALLIIGISISVLAQGKTDILIGESPNNKTLLAAEILQSYLGRMGESQDFRIIKDHDSSNNSILLVALSDISNKDRVQLSTIFPNMSFPALAESFCVNTTKKNDKTVLVICGYDQRGLLYAVYDVLEKLGCRLYLSEEFVPELEGELEFDKLNGSNAPLTGERIVFNWHNFLSGISSWNKKEYRQWIDASVKMKYNTLMFHAYGSDPFINYSLNGESKANGLVPSSIKGRDWGITHVNDIRNLYGGKQFKDSIFGSEASKMDEHEMDAGAVKLLQYAFKYAHERSLDINFGFDISTGTSNPQNILATLPKSAQLKNYGASILANPETEEGYQYFKSQIVGLLSDYPEITHITPWVRYMTYPEGGVFNAVRNMPAEWQEQYERILKQNPSFKKDQAANSFFYIGKVLEAYSKALKEMGREDVKLGLGTWNWVSYPYFDKFIPENVSFYPIDYDMNFDTEDARVALTKIKKERKVYPIIWAHHDDHSYIGRPFDPPANMVKKLEERYSEGFGILHWMTHPLDMYFKNLSRQTWQETASESYPLTIKDYAENGIKTGSAEFEKYLEQYYLEAPHFGRATSDHFFQMGFNKKGQPQFSSSNEAISSILTACKQRLEILEKLSDSDISKTEVYKYFKNMEEFYILFFDNQKMLVEAAGIWINDGDLNVAAEIMRKTYPEKAILKYAEAITHGPNTLGEQAIILRLNLNWLPDFADIKQKAGLLPIECKFYPTNHEETAQRGGHYTYYFEKNHNYNMCLGEKETNGATVLEDNNGVLRLGATAVKFPVGYWRRVGPDYWSYKFKDHKLIAGKYRWVLEANPLSNNRDGSEIIVELTNDANEVLNKNQSTFTLKNNKIIVPFEINHSLLNISIKAVESSIDLAGFKIEQVK